MVTFTKVTDSENTEQIKAKGVKEWKAGETYYGYYLRTESVETENGTQKIHYFRDSDSEGTVKPGQSAFWEGAGYARAISKVQPNQLVKMTMTERRKNPKTGNPFSAFDVLVGDMFLPDILPAPKKASNSDSDYEMDWE